MQTRLLPFLVFVSLFAFLSCTSTQNTSSTTNEGTHDKGTPIHKKEQESEVAEVDQTTNSPTTQLVDLIRRLPGVNIRGSHPNVFVSVRGTTSGSGPIGVLYVVNNKQMGNDYANVVDYLDITTVKSVNVLKGGQTAIYGSQGAGGVILIRLKPLKKN